MTVLKVIRCLTGSKPSSLRNRLELVDLPLRSVLHHQIGCWWCATEHCRPRRPESSNIGREPAEHRAREATVVVESVKQEIVVDRVEGG